MKKSVEEHYKGQPRPENHRGNSQEARTAAQSKAIHAKSISSDAGAYEHMNKHGIHRQKKSGEWVHETVGGKPFGAGRQTKLQAEARKRTQPNEKTL